ncbi:anti-sigma-K factor RskA [Nocardioides sp. J9]|uniref:anti-sigma factor n=1 Tax=Nocardioides sp. J9 TaxID=935844 RepID=UPI00119D3E34|nr:anti-sigma factor [Nocardioides sp. J9]TWG98132.1 anti-sigma-K factor RskA [Nocardioides sp. J9]
MTDHDLHALSGAYALDALDADERARFEAHLADCAGCREEVASLQEAAALLGTDEVEPPSSVRDAVLSGIGAVRPLPPITEDRPEDRTDRRPGDHAAAEDDELAGRRTRRSLLRRLGRTPLLVAAAAVLLLAVGTALVRPWADDPPPLSPEQRVLAAEDATRVQQEFPDGSRATVVLSRSEGRAVIVTEDMAPAPEGKVYEIWLQTPQGSMIPAGLMPDDPDTTLLLDGDASEATAVGITVEPDGGSPEPTSEPIAVLALDT